jgi:hypothetical protein
MASFIAGSLGVQDHVIYQDSQGLLIWGQVSKSNKSNSFSRITFAIVPLADASQLPAQVHKTSKQDVRVYLSVDTGEHEQIRPYRNGKAHKVNS